METVLLGLFGANPLRFAERDTSPPLWVALRHKVARIRRLGISIGQPTKKKQRERKMAKEKTKFFARLPGENKNLHVNKRNIRNLTLLWGDPAGLVGVYNGRYYGDCTNIYGCPDNLLGDVSKLRGDVSNVRGYCTGVELDCTGLYGDVQNILKMRKAEEEMKKHGIFLNRRSFLTNEENEKLWDVWLKLANSTIGMEPEEYKLIEHPIKNKPPFPVDVWGRHYVVDKEGDIVCFSVNPADILLLRTNQEIQTCWSVYDKNNGRGRMRLLLARACINPTVGVCFKIKTVEKFNIFTRLPFRYYKHSGGTFFQYTNEGLQPFGRQETDVTQWFKKTSAYIQPYVVGHDGNNSLGHKGQDNLMFYEKFIKDDFSLWKEKRYDKPEGTEHILANFDGVVFLDGDFKVLKKSDGLADDFVEKQIACLRKRIDTGVFDEKI